MPAPHPFGRPQFGLPVPMPSRFVIVALYVLIAVALWTPGGVDPSSSPLWELVRYALFVALSALIIGYTLMRHGIPLSGSPDWVLLSAFLLYTSLSALWSDGGFDGFIKGCLIFSAMLVSICLAYELGLETLLRVFFNALSVFVLVSILVVIFMPEVGIETGWMLEGDWRGIAGQKNGLGAIASLVLVASLSLPVKVRPDRRGAALAWGVRVAIVGMALLCTVNSGSRGALVISGLGLCLVLASRLPYAAQRVGLIALIVAAIPVVVAVFSTLRIEGNDIDVLGMAIDSNGRNTLWLYGLTQLQGREFIGFGVGGFWTPGRIQAFRDVNGWVLDNFHNGYVTIFVEGGLIGIGLLFLAMASLILLCVVAIGNIRDSYVALAFAYTMMFLIGNFSENGIGRSTSLSFIMFLAVSFAIRPHVSQAWARITRRPTVSPPRGIAQPA